MYRAVGLLTLLLTLAACRDSSSDSARPGAASGGNSSAAGAAEPGVEFDAPRLIPGVRAQASRLAEPDGATEENVSAFKSGIGTLANAMEADLNRVGAKDLDYFSKLKDSILREVGGESGAAGAMAPEKARQVTARVHRLIMIYEERMRQGAK